jgi:tRNA(His) guanylyltransferase
MNFNELDAKMRRYETLNERSFFDETDLVIRLDGRGFSGLTEQHELEKPFDHRFQDIMSATVKYLMSETGFKFSYGYHQSDEISLLLSRKDQSFERKERKLVSILASAAAAKFTEQFGSIGTFDGRVSVLPTTELVVDYFRWRQEDAARNALSGYAYWLLRQHGYNGRQAAAALNGASRADKHEVLFRYGLNFKNVPAWQKNGTGFWFEKYLKTGFNPKTGQDVKVWRNRLAQPIALPYGEEYGALMPHIIAEDMIDAAE